MDHQSPSLNVAYPMIVRIAGLPTEALEAFHGEECVKEIRRMLDLEKNLDRARAEMVDRLYPKIKGAPKAMRRFLLAVKRDCYNGRELGKHRGDELWHEVIKIAGDCAERILTLEEECYSAQKSFVNTYRLQRRSECQQLVRLLEHRDFFRGVALGSLTLAQNLPRLAANSCDHWGRREKKLALSLLRYASRTSLKLSPFSSLTRIGLGLSNSENGFQLLSAGQWRERSWVCLRRYILDQYGDILLRYPPFRDGVKVTLNDTLERIDENQYRLLRRGYWDCDEGAAELSYVRPALVKVKLGGPLVSWLLVELDKRTYTYRELLSDLKNHFADYDGEAVRRTLDQLFDVGFLIFVFPWETVDVDLEKRIKEYLDSRPADEALQHFTRLLDETLNLLDGYSLTDSPVEAIKAIGQRVEEMWKAVSPLGGVDPNVKFISEPKFHHFTEDVFVLPQEEGSAWEVARLSPSDVASAIDNVGPLVRLANLFSSRYDFLHTVAAFGAESFPGRREVDFVEFFSAAQRLFRDFVTFEVEMRSPEVLNKPKVYNPMELTELEELFKCRQKVSEEVKSCIHARNGHQVLDRSQFTELLDDIPGAYARSRDFCAFMQPLDDGESWALNSVFEGAGRMSSRYTKIMNGDARRYWTDYFTKRSIFEESDGEVELVDIFCPSGNAINVHVPQTRRILEIPGESSGLDAERVLRLRDLRIRMPSGEEVFPYLVDTAGRRIWPIHLGGLVFRFMPNLFKFLTIFGPGEFRYHIPRTSPRYEGDIEVVDRHLLGNVVYGRAAWIGERKALLPQIAGLSASKAFCVINKWRMDRGIPDQVYAVEPLGGGVENPQVKPQFIDFTSPLFVEIFRGIVQIDYPRIRLVEALPGTEQMPTASDSRRWAVEVQFDSFGW